MAGYTESDIKDLIAKKNELEKHIDDVFFICYRNIPDWQRHYESEDDVFVSSASIDDGVVSIECESYSDSDHAADMVFSYPFEYLWRDKEDLEKEIIEDQFKLQLEREMKEKEKEQLLAKLKQEREVRTLTFLMKKYGVNSEPSILEPNEQTSIVDMSEYNIG